MAHRRIAQLVGLLGVGMLTVGLTPIPAVADTPTLVITSNTTFTEDHIGGVWMGADDITLDCAGHTISAPPEGGYFGVSVYYQSNVTIKNCRVTGFTQGINVDHTSGVRVLGNTSFANSGSGFFIPESTGTVLDGNVAANNCQGIVISASTGITVTNNRVDGSCRDGIVLDLSSGNTLVGNESRGNGRGLVMVSSHDNVVASNTFEDNREEEAGWGVLVIGSSGNTFTGNLTARNGADGFRLEEGSNGNVLRENTATGNVGPGVSLSNSDDNVVGANRLVQNDAEGLAIRGSDDSVLRQNVISNNAAGGITLTAAVGTYATGNLIARNALGVGLNGSSDSLFTANRFIENGPEGWGVWIADASHDNRFVGNISRRNGYENFAIAFGSTGNVLRRNFATGSAYEGISLYFGAEYNIVRANVVTRNATSGILVYESSNNSISENFVTHNNTSLSGDGAGISVIAGSSSNEVFRNVACANGNYDAYEDATGTGNTWSENSFCLSSV